MDNFSYNESFNENEQNDQDIVHDFLVILSIEVQNDVEIDIDRMP